MANCGIWSDTRSERDESVSDELFVKICGITSEADALLCVSLGASAVGFIFAPSPRQVAVQLAGDIAEAAARSTFSRWGCSATRRRNAAVEAVRMAGLGAA